MSSLDVERKLKEAVGVAGWPLLYCPRCARHIASSYEQDFKYVWSIKLKCGKCGSEWWVCTRCPNLRKHLIEKSQLSRHHRLKHKDDIASDTNENQSEEENDYNETVEKELSIPNNYFSRSASLEYFQVALSKNDPNEYLIRKAFLLEGRQLEDSDIRCLMTVSHFVTTLTRLQREDLADVLKVIVENFLSEEHKRTSTSTSSIIPTTKQQLRSSIIEGKNSLYHNLPHPTIHTLGDHSYLLPSECIADLSAHGVLDDCKGNKIHEVEALSQSPFAKEILERNKLKNLKTVFVSIWSDDFEPNYSKSGRGSVWISTLTIQTELSGNVQLSHVYPLAVGSKGEDHNQVMETILNNLREMDSSNQQEPVMIYNGRTRQVEAVSVHLLCFVQDQPERRGFLGLLLGGLGSHARFGWICNVLEFEKNLPSCDECVKQLLENNLVTNCHHCHNFWPVNNNKCSRISFENLRNKTHEIHQKFVASQINKKTARTKLKEMCMNEKCRKDFFVCADNCKKLKVAVDSNDQEVVDAISELRQENPSEFEEWKPPASWISGFDIQRYVEPCMHQLFLGVTKSLILEIQDWASLRNKSKTLRSQIERMYQKIINLNLSWLKSEPFVGDKLGGWVSENYVAFSRVMPWVYSCIDFIEVDESDTVSEKPVNRWTSAECRDFLRRRRVRPLPKTVKELRQLVNDNYHVEVPPPVGGSPIQIRRMIIMLWAVLSNLMGCKKFNEEYEKENQCLIRLFLLTVHKHDKSTSSLLGRTVPLWISQYNFMCLLNIPDQIRLLGPIRNRWEGSQRGEGFLRHVKPIIRKNRKNWQKNLLTNLVRQKTLTFMKEKKHSTPATNNPLDQHESHSFKIYSCVTEILQEILRINPISVVLGERNDSSPIILACYDPDNPRLLELSATATDPQYHYGMHYLEFEIFNEEELEETTMMEFGEIDICCYGVLLPLTLSWPPLRVPNKPLTYTLVTSDWRTMSHEKLLVRPAEYATNRELSDLVD